MGITTSSSRAYTPLTYEDYLEFPDDGRRYEIIEGDLHVSPAPNRGHQRVLWTLANLIGNYAERLGLGEMYFAPIDLNPDPENVVQPDLIFISKERLGIFAEDGSRLTAAPDLAVEVLSPSSRKRDLKAKKTLYERIGVAEYWVVDYEMEEVHVFTRSPTGAFSPPRVLTGDAILSTPLLPSLEIPLPKLWP